MKPFDKHLTATAIHEQADEPRIDALIGLFKLLSDPTRLRILLMLREGELNVSTLCDRLDLPQPTVSHHLGLLRMSNIIENRRSGKQVFYALNGRVGQSDADLLRIGLESYNVAIGHAAQQEESGRSV
ncbi:MAG: ArsR/SmtB family transcription factor [Phycisphaerae bacterium]